MPQLVEGWQDLGGSRKDKKTEGYWRRKEAEGPLSSWQQYQKKYNFIETDYSERPSNNGLDLCNPGFAFSTKLAKYIKYDEH